MQDLGTLGGPSSSAEAINNSGEIVGRAELASGRHRPVHWDNGQIRDIDSLIAGFDPLKPVVRIGGLNDINDLGQMVASGFNDEIGTFRTYLISPIYNVGDFIEPARSSWRRGSTVRIAVALLDAAGARIPDQRAELLLVEPGCRVKVSASGTQSLASTCMRYDAVTNEYWFDWTLAEIGTGSATIEVRVNYGAPGPLKVTRTRTISITS